MYKKNVLLSQLVFSLEHRDQGRYHYLFSIWIHHTLIKLYAKIRNLKFRKGTSLHRLPTPR